MADEEVAGAVRRSFLAGLPGDVVAELVAGGQRTDYPAGSTIYREGAAPRAVLVIQGLLRVFMTSPDGRQVTVRYAREADVLDIAVIVGGPVNVAVQTVTESSLFSIDARMLTEAGRRDARVGWALDEELNRRLYDTLQQTAINTFGSVRQRVAAALLDLASAQQRPKDPPGGVTGRIYDRLARLRGQLPGVGIHKQLGETTAKVLALKETMPDLVILPAHDPTAARRLLES